MNQHHSLPGDTSSSGRDASFPAPDGRLNTHALTSLAGYPSSDRTYPLLDGTSVLHDTSQQHVRPDSFSTNQHAIPDFNTDTIPTIEQAYEALGRLRHFLDTYHRKDYLVTVKEDEMLAKIAQRFSSELAGTLIDKAQ